MKPQPFLAAFPTIEICRDTTDDNQLANAYFDGMLRRVGIDDPRDGDRTELVQLAQEVIAWDASRLQEEKERQAAQGPRLQDKRLLAPESVIKELTNRDDQSRGSWVGEDIVKHRRELGYLSSLLLARTITSASSQGFDHAPGNAIGALIPRMAQTLAATGLRIQVTKDHYQHRQIGVTRASVSTGPMGISPEWLKHVERGDDGPLDNVVGYHMELDTFTMFIEWCKGRARGYVPLFATANFDEHQLSVAESRRMNLRSDILLCRIDPDRPEIIPVQSKTILQPGVRDKYDQQVLLIGASDLGQLTTENSRIIVNGATKTGHTSTLTVGGPTYNWSGINRSNRNRKQRQKAFSKSATGTLEHLDEMVSEKEEAI